MGAPPMVSEFRLTDRIGSLIAVKNSIPNEFQRWNSCATLRHTEHPYE